MNWQGFSIDMEPVPWARPRISRGKGFHNTAKTDAARRLIGIRLFQEWRGRGGPIKDAIHLRLVFYFRQPAKPTRPYPTRCDLDNLVKLVCDALTGLLYADDRQIQSIEASKFYASEGLCGRVEIQWRS